jgi:hypothetical protein
MDIGYSYGIISYIANKAQGSYISPTEFQDSYNLAQKQYEHELIETVIGWDANRKKIKLPAANLKQAKQKLAPFMVVGENVAIPGTGHLVKPIDMADIISMRTVDDKVRIWRVEEDRLASHLSSVIDQINEAPIYVEKDTYYKLYPTLIGAINWEYYKIAPDVKYDYTIVSGRPVYNQAGSIDSLFGDLEQTDILARVLFMFGISIQANQLVQYYNDVTKSGQ